MPEFNRKGLAVFPFWLEGGKHDEAPTDRNSHLLEPQWGTVGPPFLREGPHNHNLSTTGPVWHIRSAYGQRSPR